MVSSDLLISLRNSILPAFLVLSTAGSLLLPLGRFKKFVPIFLIFLAIVEYSYFFNKYQPFSPAKFVFPQHPVFSFLQGAAGPARYFGDDSAYIDNNFATYYRVYAPEGYDPLYIRRYGELLANSREIARSDAWVGKSDSPGREKLFDLLGIKYLVDITGSPTLDTGQNFAKFPKDKFAFAGQINQWKFYQRRTVFPRAFLADEYVIGSLKEIHDPNINLRQTLVLEKEPALKPESGPGTAEIIAYKPNTVTIISQSEKPKLLFLSDNYYPGWRALVDNSETEILRADHTFRAVAVPAGVHTVTFIYDSLSFKIGLGISLAALCILLILWRKSKN